MPVPNYRDRERRYHEETRWIFWATLALGTLAMLAGCVDTTGVYRHEVVMPPCPTPAPIVNDQSQLPSTFPWGCPYQVRQPDGSVITVVFMGFDK